MTGCLYCAFLFVITLHITSFNSTTEFVVISVICWCYGALLCLALSHITSFPPSAEDNKQCCVSQLWELK